METIIEMRNLRKTYKILNRREGLAGSIRDLFSRDYNYINAVENITANIKHGEMVGFLGPNGAGKSTAIKMMTGVLEPSGGEILVDGIIPYRNRNTHLQNIGVVFGQRTQLWWSLPYIESLKILKKIYRIDIKTYNENVELFDDIANISSLFSKPIRQMSLGQRTLCDIAAALLHNPKIVFLDEPTIGLDVTMKSKIRNIISNVNETKGTTVVITTHDIGDVEALCERVIIIDNGRFVYDDKFTELRKKFGRYRILKLTLNEKSNNNILLMQDIIRAFSENSVVILENNTEPDIMNLLVNEDETTLIEVLNVIMKTTKVVDIKIDEVDTEDIIKRIYEGKGYE